MTDRQAPRERIEAATLALLSLGLHDGIRAWKGFDRDVLDRLHSKGLIENPRNRAKSVVFTPEGLAAARKAFENLFGD